ncbi:MAG TPA: CDP-alcohol phosphatidyltransferase [Micromonosporaceae bacterium]|nr:CDP-alcohol phosphatidyltransferase [Micromonosporaceae bacterium]HCU51316.1 CDP-alcohol phosphatidyltransferase [Micromonosporaceae bacterium]
MSIVLRVDDFYASNRGGGLFSEAISQRLGSVIALGAARLGAKPTIVTLTNLMVGLATSITVALLSGRMTPVIGLVALVGWQLAYAMDCADGQLARVTGQASPAGARVDVLCDVASHIALVTALVMVAKPPIWVAALFAGSWMINIITSVLPGDSLIPSRSLGVRVVKLIRDYGALVFSAGLILIVNPSWMIWFLALLIIINSAFLVASLAHSARSALSGRGR